MHAHTHTHTHTRIHTRTHKQVNAWTTSRVQRSLLSLFCRQEAVLPNFWVGSLTHDSVGSALETGINAEEIIGYLKVRLCMCGRYRFILVQCRGGHRLPEGVFVHVWKMQIYSSTMQRRSSVTWRCVCACVEDIVLFRLHREMHRALSLLPRQNTTTQRNRRNRRKLKTKI